jgi:DAPG hydrolase PhiG domain
VSAPDLSAYLKRPLTPPEEEALAAVEAGPCDPRTALELSQVDRLLDPEPLAVETGWWLLRDGTAQVAARTPMPGVSAEMVDWWFDWHPRDAIRYRIWHPVAHFDNSLQPPSHPGAKPYWGAVHHPVEDVGTGVVHARICFQDPALLGMSAAALGGPRVGTVLAAHVGDDRRRVRHSVMFHVFLAEDDGLVLRSRFWLGAAIRPYGPAGVLLEGLLNRPQVRRRMLPPAVPRALARHCVEEYANLAALLPELYERFSRSPV